jgi:hypothetical protein
VEFRYYDTSHADYPKLEELKWETAANEIQKALDQAQLDGQPIYCPMKTVRFYQALE